MDQPSKSAVTTPNTTVTTNAADWSNLPSDILQHLLKYIDITLDLPRFRGVCSTWRTSLPVPKLPSHFHVPDIDAESELSLILIESRFYLISPHGDPTTPWLARMADIGPNKWHLLDPFNLEDYFHSDPSITTRISLFDSNLIELAKLWSLQDASGKKTMSKKVVGGWNLDGSYDFDFAVLAQLELPFRSGLGGLVFNRLGEDWVRIKGTFPDDKKNSQYRILDIAYHNGLFYAFELANWKVGVIDPSETEISFEFMDAPNCLGETIDDSYSVLIDGANYILCGVYLVPCNAKLYLVISSRKAGSKKETFFVFVLKEGDAIEEHKWERVTSLGDQILFIGYDVSFGVSSTILPNWKPGSICLFTRPFPLFYDSCSSTFQGLPEGAECIKMISYPEYWRYLKMYNMEEEEKGIVEFEELSVKEYTGLFFPPPAWVKWDCPSLDDVEIRLHNLKFSRLKKLGDADE